jgi:carboxylate-amine ligase
MHTLKAASGSPDAPGVASPYLPGERDEALTPEGRPRPGYEQVMGALAEADLGGISESIKRHLGQRQVNFRSEVGSRAFHVDPVPRILEAAEWDGLAAGMRQRARALNDFIADVYGDQRIVKEGVVPARVIESARHFEPEAVGVQVHGGHAPVVGFDLVRGADGRFGVLEENLRTPSGLAYGSAARRAVDAAVPFDAPSGRRELGSSFSFLREAIRLAAPDGDGDPSMVLLSDGPSNSAWYEHRELATRLDIPILTAHEIHQRFGRLHYTDEDGRSRAIQVVYRRTDEDRLVDERGNPTWIADLLFEPVRRGRVSVVNGLGAGVGDDKLTHAYVQEMIRFYLGEEPVLSSVHTYDLGDDEAREEVLGRLDEMVVKPRAGYGGEGVVICRDAPADDLRRIARLIHEQPVRFVAQELVALSSHPTVCDGELAPRHVDLRAFSIGKEVAPGTLTRVALRQGSMIVNSSRDGGGKDTWLLS